MIQFLSLLSLGFVLGLAHALEADHVAAVSTLLSQTKTLKKASWLGLTWGCGHTFTLFVAGFIILGFKVTIPNKLALSFELIVGLVLVLLGIDVLRKLRDEKAHFHQHRHDQMVHAHLHSHKMSPEHQHLHKSFLVGMLHGLAGSAAMSLFVLTTAASLFHGLLYILIFGLGSTFGMLALSTLLGIPCVLTAGFDKVDAGVRLLAGAASIVLGISIIYQTGFGF